MLVAGVLKYYICISYIAQGIVGLYDGHRLWVSLFFLIHKPFCPLRMRNLKRIFLVGLCSMGMLFSAMSQEAVTDTLISVKGDGSNRNLLLNAASASQPRQISLGLPTELFSYIFEDGLPVSYYNLPIYPYKTWHGGLSHESVSTMSPQDMVLKYGIITYSVDSKSRFAGDTFEGKLDYTLNQYGRQMLDANLSIPIRNGWGVTLSSYQNFDRGSNHLDMSYLQERTQFYKAGLSKKWGEGRGRVGLFYQYSSFMNIIENFGPFIFVGDGSIKEYEGFSLGRDPYLPANNTIRFLNLVTGKEQQQQINDANTDRVHNLNFVMDYTWDNGIRIAVNSKLKHGHSYRANSQPSGISDVVAGSGITYEDGTEFVGPAQNRRMLRFDAFEHSWMSNVELSGKSPNRRHDWKAELDYWLNHSGTNTSMYMFMHEVKKSPRLLLVNGNGVYAQNAYAEFYNGHEHKLFGYVADEWTVNNRLWLKGGARLEYLNVRGWAINDTNEGNARHNDFAMTDENVVQNRINNSHLNYSFIVGGRLALAGGFGLQAEYSQATIHSQLFHYGVYPYPTQKGITATYFRGGIYFKNSWLDLTSQITNITMKNSQLRSMLSHELTKDIGHLKAGMSETITYSSYYGQSSLGWLTDAMVNVTKGLNVHALFTLRNPKYKDFELNPTFSDGVTEHYDFSGKNITSLSKMEIEMEPSYTFDSWRVWLSARYFSKQYINKSNSLYFNGRWETFGGVDYTLNKQVKFSANIINILNQKGASGLIPSADLVTDPTPYKNYLMAGTFIRPFTFEFTTHLSF